MRKARQAIWTVLSMFAVFYIAASVVDYYRTFTPAGLTGRCYSLQNPNSKDRDVSVKILGNNDQSAQVQVVGFPGRMIFVTHRELRERMLEEVKCEKSN